MRSDFSAATDGVYNFLAVRVGQGLVFDLYIYFPDRHERAESHPLGQSDKCVPIYIRYALAYAGKESMENVVAPMP